MNVLIAADIFPPQAGGPATYAVAIANALTLRGVSVRIVSLNPQSDHSLVSCHLSVVSSKNKLFRYLEYAWLLWKHAQCADVIYAMGPVNAGLPALLTARLRGKPFAVKVVGDYAWEQGIQRFGVKDGIDAFQKKQHGGVVGILQRIQSFVVQRAARVIVPCRYLKVLVEGWGASAKRICVVYNAPTAPPRPAGPKPASERWIVSAGRLVPWKGMAGLIDVVASLKDGAPDTRLKIIGDGPERSKLEARVRNLQAGDRVEFLGALPHEKTLSVIAAADAFVLNSGYEGLSHVLLEAMALGVPVVASSVGGNPEIVTEERLFPVDDRQEMRVKILAALADAAPSPLGDAFTMQKLIDRTQEVLQSLTQDI